MRPNTIKIKNNQGTLDDVMHHENMMKSIVGATKIIHNTNSNMAGSQN